jgi:hypothetical protein
MPFSSGTRQARGRAHPAIADRSGVLGAFSPRGHLDPRVHVVEHRFRRLASHQDTLDRFVHPLGHVCPVGDVRTAHGAGQGLLDRLEGLALLGRHAAVRVVADRRPRVALDQHLLRLARHEESGQRQGSLATPPFDPPGDPENVPAEDVGGPHRPPPSLIDLEAPEDVLLGKHLGGERPVGRQPGRLPLEVVDLRIVLGQEALAGQEAFRPQTLEELERPHRPRVVQEQGVAAERHDPLGDRDARRAALGERERHLGHPARRCLEGPGRDAQLLHGLRRGHPRAPEPRPVHVRDLDVGPKRQEVPPAVDGLGDHPGKHTHGDGDVREVPDQVLVDEHAQGERVLREEVDRGAARPHLHLELLREVVPGHRRHGDGGPGLPRESVQRLAHPVLLVLGQGDREGERQVRQGPAGRRRGVGLASREPCEEDGCQAAGCRRLQLPAHRARLHSPGRLTLDRAGQRPGTEKALQDRHDEQDRHD